MGVIDAVVVDGDRTLWKGSSTGALGKAYLLKTIRELNLYKAANYAFGIAYVNLIVNAYRDSDGIPSGQRKFYDIMIENSIGMKEEMNSIVGRHIRKNAIEKVARRIAATSAEKTAVLAPTMQNNLTILSTCGCGSCPRCVVNAAVVTANTAMALIGLRRKEKKPVNVEHDHSSHGHKHE